MRYPEGHKEAIRERIVTLASESLRAKGIDGVSIPALMKRAGLTHGGFYAHFRNRDELVSEALRAAGDATAKTVFSDGRSLRACAKDYLSMDHVLCPSGGCVVAALATEGPRQAPPVRRAMARLVKGLIGLVQSRGGEAAGAPSDDTLVRVSTMVGAVVLARACGDEALAARIVSASLRAVSA